MYIPMDIINLIADFSPYYYFEHQKKMYLPLHHIKCYNWNYFYYMKYQKPIIYTQNCIVCN